VHRYAMSSSLEYGSCAAGVESAPQSESHLYAED